MSERENLKSASPRGKILKWKMFKRRKLRNKWKISILLKLVATITIFYFDISFKCDKKLIQGQVSYKTLCLQSRFLSRPEVYCKKGVFRNFAKFTGKQLRQSLFFNNVVDLRPAALLKKEALAQVFPCEFCEMSENPFLQNTSSGSLSVQVCDTK